MLLTNYQYAIEIMQICHGATPCATYQYTTNMRSICYHRDIATLLLYYQYAIRTIPLHCLCNIAVHALCYNPHLPYEINTLTIFCQCAIHMLSTCYGDKINVL